MLTEKIVGYIERLDATGVEGFVVDVANPNRSLTVAVWFDGTPLVRLRPQFASPAVAQLLGRTPEEMAPVVFRFRWPVQLFDHNEHTVQIFCQQNGALLTGGEKRLLFPAPGVLIPIPADEVRDAEPLPCSAEKPQVSVIVLNRNGETLLPTLFDSFLRFNSVPVEWIVIDHASTDRSREILARYQQRIPLRTIALDYNDSFSASCNRGAALAQCEHLLFLNNDIVWVHDALPIMIQRLQNDRSVGAVGLKLVKEEEGWVPEVQHLGVRFTRVGDRYWPYEVNPLTDPDQPVYSPAFMPAVTGAVLLCRRADFQAVGGFDEQYFYGYEDVDLCLRLEMQLGKKSLCCNDLIAIHRHGYTRLSGRERSVTDRLHHNADIFEKRWGVWLKQQMRVRRWTGDRIWFSRPLQAWILVKQAHERSPNEQQKKGLNELLQRWQKQIPHAQWRLVLSTQPWQTIHDADLLLVTSEEFDLREMEQLPADTLCLACDELGADLALWQQKPWWGYFHGTSRSNPQSLLEQIRVGLYLPFPPHERKPHNPSYAAALSLLTKLRQNGLWVLLLSAEEIFEAKLQIDVQIYCFEPTYSFPSLLRHNVIRILWALSPIKEKKNLSKSFDLIWQVARPNHVEVRALVKKIRQLWSKRVGDPFHSP